MPQAVAYVQQLLGARLSRNSKDAGQVPGVGAG
jgi:hypothetical protein